MRRNCFLAAGFAIAVAGVATNAMAQSEIKIGEINSYSLLPAFTEPYRKGWQLAVEQVNAAGGINGKKLVDRYSMNCRRVTAGTPCTSTNSVRRSA